MIALEELVTALLDSVPLDTGGADDGVRIEVDEVVMTLPVEVRIGARGALEASAPRGRYATGFDAPTHVMSIGFTTRGAE